ncbi:MAG: hypothetical protein AB7V39_21515 [Nitrospiraceae bacterium]
MTFLGTTGSGVGTTYLSHWQFLEHRRQGDPQRPTDRVDRRAWRGSQQRPTAVLFDLDTAESKQVIDQAPSFRRLPPRAASAAQQFLAQHQGQERAFNVPADRGIGAVEHRPSCQQ